MPNVGVAVDRNERKGSVIYISRLSGIPIINDSNKVHEIVNTGIVKAFDI